MRNEWSNGVERVRGPNSHVAALLTSALLNSANGSARPGATTAMSEAAQAVNLYRCVLAALNSVERRKDEEFLDPSGDSAAMQMLEITRDGAKYRYRTYLYDKLDDALNYARLETERESKSANAMGTY